MFCCLVLDPSSPAVAGALAATARACSPRVEIFDTAAIFDATGLARVIGPPAEIVTEVQRLAERQGLVVRVAIAKTMTAAWLLAQARPGGTVAMGEPANAIATLPVGWLGTLARSGLRLQASGLRLQDTGLRPQTSDLGPGLRTPASGPRAKESRKKTARAGNFRQAPGPAISPAEVNKAFLRPEARGLRPDSDTALDADRVGETLAIFERWGLRTLGDVAQLPAADLLTRLGPTGARLHQAAHGQDVVPLVATAESPRFAKRVELEWPIEGLEPLAFVLGRLTESLSATLERADRGAVTITTRLGLVTRVTHERTLHVPAPMRDPRVLRTLIVLDLESHPPPAAIDVVEIVLEVTPGRIEQGSLLTRTVPTPENLATLVARLGALMGESRVGAPALVDTHDDREIAMTPFTVRRFEGASVPGSADLRTVVRRFRLPISARVQLEQGTPVRIEPSSRDLPGGRVIACAGPWRSSGAWWAPFNFASHSGSWQRDEWDVEIAGGAIYRLARDRDSGHWAIDAVID